MAGTKTPSQTPYVVETPQAILDDTTIAEQLPFDDLSSKELQTMLDLATIEKIGPDKTVFDQGDEANHFYLLLDGALRILRTTADGEQVVVLHIMPGEMFGIARAFDNDTYNSSARAASPGVALCWPSHVWDQFIRDYAGFKTASRRAVGFRLGEMQDKIVQMATLKVEQRIAQAILSLMRQAGKETDEGIEITFPITRQDISEMTGTTLHSVSRYMSKWQKSGIVNGTRRRVVICRPEDLPV